MKTLFLCTVLFVLLAFAFKSPDQSAWDFAREAGSNVFQKMTASEKEEKTPELARNLERNVEKNFDSIKRRLKERKKITGPVDSYGRGSPKVSTRAPKPSPKPQSIKRPEKALAHGKQPSGPRRAAPKPGEKELEFIVEPGPSLPPHPLEEVAREHLPESISPTPETKPVPTPTVISRPLNSAELAEIGARFDRASRLLSQIK